MSGVSCLYLCIKTKPIRGKLSSDWGLAKKGAAAFSRKPGSSSFQELRRSAGTPLRIGGRLAGGSDYGKSLNISTLRFTFLQRW